MFSFPSILYPKTAKKSANNRFHVKLVKYSNFYDIRADVWPILMKFCMMTHIGYPEHNSCSKSEIYQYSRWWTLPYDKIVKCDISAIVSLILIKFAATMHISTATSIPGPCIHWGMTPLKVSISFYSLPLNSEKSANNRFHVKLVKYSNFYDIRADVWPILMKFCMMTHIGYPEHNSCSKSEI